MSAALTTSDGLRGAARLVIQPAAEGVYLFLFETDASAVPERDYLQERMEDALEQAAEDFGAAGPWAPWEGPSLV